MFDSISRRIIVVFGLLVLMMGGIFFGAYTMSQSSADAPLRLNLGARQRMMAERMGRRAVQYAGAETAAERAERRGPLLRDVQLFADSHNAFVDGGKVPLDLSNSQHADLSRASSTEEAAALALIQTQWWQMKGAIETLLSLPDPTLAAARAIEMQIDPLLAAANEYVVAAQTTVEANRKTLLLMFGAAVLAMLVLAFLATVLIRRSFAGPLASLASATEQVSLGHLDRPIPTDGPLELRSLAASVERLRLATHAVLNQGGASDTDEDDPFDAL
jgi:nitrate/nitrite-specific signal transduction histidine kinase